MRNWILFLLTLGVCWGCRPPETEVGNKLYNFDSLLTAQAKQWSAGGAALIKSTSVNSVRDSVLLSMNASDWQREVEVYKKLESVNRPSYRTQYRERQYDDPRSNLTVREFEAAHAPVGLLRFYFLHSPEKLQRIEAFHREQSFFFHAERQFVLQFESPGSGRVIQFAQRGGQKIVLGDTTVFSISGRVQLK